jgi:hypothetical protein
MQTWSHSRTARLVIAALGFCGTNVARRTWRLLASSKRTSCVGLATTLLQPDSGHGRVASLHIVRDAVALRSAIALVGQYAAVDEN